MQRQIYEIASTIGFSANSSQNIDIPRDGYITHLDCLLELKLTTPSGGVTDAEDPLARIINAARIKASGAKNFFDITDGRQWKYYGKMLYQHEVLEDSTPAAGNTATVRMALPIHWGFDPYDPFDRTVVVPAINLTNLKFEIDWGAVGDLTTSGTYTIDTANSLLRVTLYELVLEAGESEEDIWPAGLIAPRFEPITKTTTVQSNLGFDDEVPVGDTLYMILGMITDSASGASNVRDDTYVSEVGIKMPKISLTPFKYSTWYQMKATMRRQFALDSDITGVFLLPMNWISGEPFGIDLTGAMTGDVKLGFTVPSGKADGTIHIVYYSLG